MHIDSLNKKVRKITVITFTSNILIHYHIHVSLETLVMKVCTTYFTKSDLIRLKIINFSRSLTLSFERNIFNIPVVKKA